MSKKIIYFVRNYSPSNEGVSKEVALLSQTFKPSFLFDLSSKLRLTFGKNFISFFKFLFPFYLLIYYAERQGLLSHIYSSLGDLPYLRILNKKPLILTSSSASSKLKISQNLDRLKKIDRIVVQCERDKKTLLSLGIPFKKIQLIYPGVELSPYQKPSGRFKVLFLSSPFTKSYFKARGITLIIKAAKKLPHINFTLVWRKKGGTFDYVKKLTHNIPNFTLIPGPLPPAAIIRLFNHHHLTIAPFVGSSKNKPCPNSIIESLAFGKPVLVTKAVGISDLIRKEKCGLVINPLLPELVKALLRLRKNYSSFQKNTHSCAQKYFDKKKSLNKYKRLYHSFLNQPESTK